MDTINNSFRDELVSLTRQVAVLLDSANAIPGIDRQAFAQWQKTCDSIITQIAEDILRVAVVGSIKSGKSTFVNSLLSHDYLKRGAGVVTSIVTRVRGGSALKAELIFKSWDEVNADINDALVLFPSSSFRSADERVDLRRLKDRQDLEKALAELSGDQLISHGRRNANSVLLSAYMKGYERVEGIVSSESTTRTYTGSRFAEHRDFVGHDSLAVYLRDIQLDVGSEVMDESLEIADCQGSDSPNPHHLTMIQDYLLKTNLLIYVVSSRTGLREADISFLSMIKKMGIVDNIIFIINCDFNEHESIGALERLVEKVKHELGFFLAHPEIYTFSSLYNLFKSSLDHLSEKDRAKYAQWETETALTAYSDHQTQRFERAFEQKFTLHRYLLLYKNHLERLAVVLEGLGHWILLHRQVLSTDRSQARRAIEQIDTHRVKVEQLKSMVKSTLNGAADKIKKGLRDDVERFFDPRGGRLIPDLVAHVRAYRLSSGDYQDDLQATGFASTLYLVFQDFKHHVDTFMAETVNPEIVNFLLKEETKILDDLMSVAGPYEVMVGDALSDYDRTLKGLGIPRLGEDSDRPRPPGLSLPEQAGRLAPPPAVATLRYGVKIKAEAVARFGFYSVIRRLKKMLKRSVGDNDKKEAMQALEAGTLRMKRETEKSILTLFRDYKESIKFQTLIKLTDSISDTLYHRLLERFQTCSTDLSKTAALIDDHKKDKQGAMDILAQLDRSHQVIVDDLDRLKQKLSSTDIKP